MMSDLVHSHFGVPWTRAVRPMMVRLGWVPAVAVWLFTGCSGGDDACAEAEACCVELGAGRTACEDAVRRARETENAARRCRDAVEEWRSAGLCGGSSAETDGGPSASAAPSCTALRDCCQQLGTGTATCLASLSAIERGSNAEEDCAASLRSFVDGEECSVAGQPGPEMSDATCSDGVDNDDDGFIDCGNAGTQPDFDCTGGPDGTGRSYCGELNCTDGVDNDANGDRDCEDMACNSDPACGDENTAARCSDGIDNDGDGYIDCGRLGGEGDRGCTDRFCGDEVCDNGTDDDGDGRYDCGDADCEGVASCGPENTNAACSDGIDNDGDGFIDCGGFTEPDFDCTRNPSVTVCSDV